MKTKTTWMMMTALAVIAAVSSPALLKGATVTGRSAKTGAAGTEKIPIDDSGTDKYITIAELMTNTVLELDGKTLASPIVSGGLTASGSGANDFSASTGPFKTSSGVNTFNGSSHLFAAGLRPIANDGGALGSVSYAFSDLFLADGGVINFSNSDITITQGTDLLTIAGGNVIVSSPGTASGSVVTVDGTQTQTNKTLTSPVINGATSSGSTTIDLSGNSGAFKTPSGINTLSGAVVTSSTITQTSASGSAFVSGPNGGTNPVFQLVNSVSSAATGLSVTGRAATAGVDLTVLSSGTNENLVINAKGSGTITLNPTGTGNVVMGRAMTTAFAITQTSASATAFESGPNGGTNPVLRLVNNVSSAATGLSITGRAAAAGVDLTVLSSGTNENLVINAKGSGVVLLNGAGTGAVNVGDNTTPALSVVHTTEGTGVSITSAAAASGVAVAAISSGTNENVTFDAKGSGTITLNGTGTGNVVLGRAATGVSLTTTGVIASSGTAGIGYAAGAGGVVTQATNKSTGVTLNKVTGQVTMNNASLADATNVSFTVTNSTVAATDVVQVVHSSGGTAGAYHVEANAIGAGSFKITVRNRSGGSLSEAIVLTFVVIKGQSS